MKLSISNIGWTAENDDAVYAIMKQLNYAGLEIAPTRIFPEEPYNRLEEASKWAKELKERFGFAVASMQSIWFGRSEKVFGTDWERKEILDYTKKAIDFASACNCKNLVFGCPRNRAYPEEWSVEMVDKIAIPFFKELGDYAFEKNTVLVMEANPPIYNTNFINGTCDAFELISKVDSKGFLLNLDLGTMIENGEGVDVISDKVEMINHVHISEPGLKVIERREIHNELIEVLNKENYEGFVSIEMGKQENLENLKSVMNYVCELINR